MNTTAKLQDKLDRRDTILSDFDTQDLNPYRSKAGNTTVLSPPRTREAMPLASDYEKNLGTERIRETSSRDLGHNNFRSSSI